MSESRSQSGQEPGHVGPSGSQVEHFCLRFTFIVSHRHFDQRYSVIFQPEFSSRFIHQALAHVSFFLRHPKSPKMFPCVNNPISSTSRVKALSYFFNAVHCSSFSSSHIIARHQQCRRFVRWSWPLSLRTTFCSPSWDATVPFRGDRC